MNVQVPHRLAGIVCALLSLMVWIAPAAAAPAVEAGEGSIDHVETRRGELRVLYSLPELPTGASPDLDSLAVDINGTRVPADAELAATAQDAKRVRRTAVMAIDTSNSMRGERFVQAKAAAQAFLDEAPEDLLVGIVAFAGDVEVVQQPTLDRDTASSVVDELSLSRETRLNDAVIAAAEAAGTSGQRSLLVLSDGRDTSDTSLETVISSIKASGARVDVVALGAEATEANRPLEAMADAGRGNVLAAKDPDALTSLFNEEAAALARQVLVTAPVTPDVAGTEGSVQVSLTAGGTSYEDRAFVSFGSAIETDATASKQTPTRSPLTAPLAFSPQLLWIGLAGLGMGLLLLLLGALGMLGGARKPSVEDKISAYTRAPGPRGARSQAADLAGNAAPRSVTNSALDLAQKALEGNKSFEARVGAKLEGADVSLKPAEWLLLHAGIAVAASLLGLLLSSGSILFTLLFLVVGAIVPWMYLSFRKSRRLKAFNGQLAETLQLIAGSLSAGLSLAQSLDTVVREGSDPVAGEFRRALVEARLGVPVEESLDAIAKRMDSDDFAWIVMAIRIQREVGGNLSELLLQVAATMRERDYLRRQVKTLSAEGKMSAWILGALPPGMLAYMLFTNPAYVQPMVSTLIGWAMLAGAVVLMAVGAFWMSRVVKVDV